MDDLKAVIEAKYQSFPELVAVYDVFNREEYRLPVADLIQFIPNSPDFVLSIPHAGVFVPSEFVDRFDLSEKAMVEIDLFSDVIYETLGGLRVVSWLAPFFIDMNRADPSEHGEGVPRHLLNKPHEYMTVDDRPILKRPYSPAETKEVLRYYDLYHDIVSAALNWMKRQFGYGLLIDGHSMTAVGQGRVYDEGHPRDNFVVGTLHDTSADAAIIDAFVETLKKSAESFQLGFTVAKNVPYSGGFITRKHHNPNEHFHAIQIEVTMDTYMYEAVDRDLVRRYALKQPRIKIVRDILRKAIHAACDAARKIYCRS
ncbi:MAG: hypothetical protein KatS3mg105_1769 [Gemmatales bacterium]|nr:MAG: hypothetical protein KatS3mg105_1769 [Gemmatales bacterium]